MSNSSSSTSWHASVDDCEPSTKRMGSFRNPQLNLKRAVSDTAIASTSRIYPIPWSSLLEHPVNDVLARQLCNLNTTRAKQPIYNDDDSSDDDITINDALFKATQNKLYEEKRRQEELRRVEENLQKQKHEDDRLIDLMSAIRLPEQVHQMQDQTRPDQKQDQMEDINLPSTSNSTESTPIMDTKHYVRGDIIRSSVCDLRDNYRNAEQSNSPKLICRMRQRSSYGKVMSARYKPTWEPYKKINEHPVTHNRRVFDFTTPSLEDITPARQGNPSYYDNSNRLLSVYE